MVVDNCNIRRTHFRPTEDDPPLIVNADGMQSGTLSFQGLQSIAGRNQKIGEIFGGMQSRKLTGSNSRDL